MKFQKASSGKMPVDCYLTVLVRYKGGFYPGWQVFASASSILTLVTWCGTSAISSLGIPLLRPWKKWLLFTTDLAAIASWKEKGRRRQGAFVLEETVQHRFKTLNGKEQKGGETSLVISLEKLEYLVGLMYSVDLSKQTWGSNI